MFHRLVAINITDPAAYRRYRDAMTPLLHAAGGKFSYDFEIAQTLRSDAIHPVNRLFLISFPDKAAHDAFFADERYKAIRKEWYEPAVDGATTIAVMEDR